MSIMRRMGMAKFGKIAGGSIIGSYTLTSGSDFGTDLNGCALNNRGYNTSIGSLSPSSIITALYHNESQNYDLKAGCSDFPDAFYLVVSSYTGTATGLFTSVTYPRSGGTTTLNSSAAAFSGGTGGTSTWIWSGASVNNLYPINGTVTIV